MTMPAFDYPLRWPDGWPRTPTHARRDSRHQFRRGSTDAPWLFEDAAKELDTELGRLGASNVVISSDYQLRRDGTPIRKVEPMDSGIAVYFQLKGEGMVMAADMHQRTTENLRSLALAVDAMRTLERHGGGTMLKRAIAGFTALPAPSDWRGVLGFDPEAVITEAGVRKAFSDRVQTVHPDKPGGSAEAFQRLTEARDKALEEARNGR